MSRLPLQSVLPKKVYLNNIVIGRQRDASFVVDDKKYEFSFTFPFRDYKPVYFLKIKLSDHVLWLSLEKLPPLGYFSEKFKDVELSALPKEIQPVVLESCFNNVLDAVEEELGVVVSIESYTESKPDNNFEDELQFSVNIEGVEALVHGGLHMEGSSLEFLAALLERTSYGYKSGFSSLEVPTHVVIGEETLTLGEFRGLNLRDIIFLGNENYGNNGSCKVIVGDYLIYGGVLENGTVTLENLMDERANNEGLPKEESYDFEDEGEDMDFLSEEDSEDNSSEEDYKNEEGEEEPEGEVSKELSDLPIHIVFEVGQKRLALKELQSLKTGYTFELESPVDHPVTIRANGRVIGSGELLKVGERVGVRVTSFAKK